MFAYCNNNPVNYIDPSGHLFIDWDLCPNEQAGREFAIWYMQTNENDTDDESNLSLDAKFKKTVRALATSIEFEVGIGIGLYGGFNIDRFASFSAGVFYDLLRIRYINGQYEACQYAYTGIDGNLFYYLLIPGSKELCRSYLNAQSQWVELNEDEVYDMYGFGAYFFGGFSAEVNWDVLGLIDELSNIWRE